MASFDHTGAIGDLETLAKRAARSAASDIGIQQILTFESFQIFF